MGRPAKENLAPELLEVVQQIGANIVYYREQIKMSQAELSRQSGVSLSTLNEMETRRNRDIRVSTLSAISKVLDVPVRALLETSDVKIPARDQAQLLKASEAIQKVIKRMQR